MFLSAFGAGKPLAVAVNNAGVLYTLRNINVGLASASGGRTYGAGLFAVADPASICATSADGVNWANSTNTNAVRQLLHNGTQFIGISDTPSILTSSDARIWTVQNSTPYSPTDGTAFALVNGVYCYVIGVSGYVAYSSDLANWSYISVHSGPIKSLVQVSAGAVVAMCFDGTIYSTSNGSTWIYNYRVYDSGTGNSGQVYIADASGSTIVCAGDGVLQTRNAGAWNVRTPPTYAAFPMWGIFINNLFVLFYSNGEIYTSANSINWTQKVASQGTQYAHAISNGTTLLVAVSSTTSLVVTSP